MAGIYIHIPFCKSKCAYCDFFSVASMLQKENLIKSLITEIKLQKSYLENECVETIYFGGGTPSVFSIEELTLLLNVISENYKKNKNIEITLEANPDDLTSEYLSELRNVGINRLSIGVQSFNDRHLKLMRRRHSAEKAKQSIIDARKIGFDNISADLIYGLPGMTMKEWGYNLNVMLDLNIQHISAYNLTIEPNTHFNKWIMDGKIKLPTETKSKKQFELLIEKTKSKQFIHYEISNFALEGFISQHNSNYWMNKKYLGIGPSAHSYNLTSRQWNISNVTKYIEQISKGKIPFEKETLTLNNKFNEYIMTSLRTIWGIDLNKVEKDFGKTYYDFLNISLVPFLKNKYVQNSKDKIILTQEGVFLSDYIIRSLLRV